MIAAAIPLPVLAIFIGEFMVAILGAVLIIAFIVHHDDGLTALLGFIGLLTWCGAWVIFFYWYIAGPGVTYFGPT